MEEPERNIVQQSEAIDCQVDTFSDHHQNGTAKTNNDQISSSKPVNDCHDSQQQEPDSTNDNPQSVQSSCVDTTNHSDMPQVIHRHKADGNESGNEELDSEFACSVCLQLSVQPTTLTCGHTTCRSCLAQWYFSSNKKECPLCKTTYQGHPKVNTQLRNLLRKLYPAETESREKEAEDENFAEVISKFDKELSKESSSYTSKSEITSFCSGILVATCLFVATYLAWYWKSHDESLLVKKPVMFWTPGDLRTWLKEIPWAGQYAQLAQNKSIDGRLLLSANEDDLTRLMNISETSHVKALMLLINSLQETGLKMPANIWEYKALYPGRCLFLVFGLKSFPRTTILYLWMYFREEMFNPFVIATQQEKEIESYLYDLNGTESMPSFLPDKQALIGFIVYTIFLPEYLVGVFAVQMFKFHFFTPSFVLATIVFRVILEALKVEFLFRHRSWRVFFNVCKEHVKHLTSAFMFMVLWPIIPSLVCDIFFYCSLYVSPIQLGVAVYKKIIRQEE